MTGGGILKDGGGTAGEDLRERGGHGPSGGAGGCGGAPGVLVGHALLAKLAVGLAVECAAGLHGSEGHSTGHGAGGDGGGDTGGHAGDGAGDGSREAGIRQFPLRIDQGARIGGIGSGEGGDAFRGGVRHQTGCSASGAENGAGDVHEAGDDVGGDQIPPATPSGAALHFIRIGEGLLRWIGGGHGILLAPLGEVLPESGLIGKRGEERLAIHAAVFRPEGKSGFFLLRGAGGFGDDGAEGGFI